MMTYEQAREFIRDVSVRGSVLGLENIRALMRVLGDVQEQLPIIHIAGTNGKGSVGAYLEAILREAGYHVGRYVTPAVFDPLELWQYDGQIMTREEYADVMSQVKDACDILTKGGGTGAGDAHQTGIFPTVFEIETAAAFVYFSRKKPDFLLLEVMMGGSTDATNVITKPVASVITSISMDHMQFLGSTREEIAAVKAGIIKAGCPVFCAPQTKGVERVLRERAAELSAPITFVREEGISLLSEEPGRMRFSYGFSSETVVLETCMAGHYQMKNAALAVETAARVLAMRESLQGVEASESMLPTRESRKLSYANRLDAIRRGIEKVVWPGRFEVISRNPLFIIDGAHNEEAAEELAKTVQNCFTNQKIIYIIGVLGDKEHEKMLRRMLPFAKCVYTVTPENPRALDGRILAEEARKIAEELTEVYSCENLREAVERACSHAEPVLAFGSLSYLGALRQIVIDKEIR